MRLSLIYLGVECLTKCCSLRFVKMSWINFKMTVNGSELKHLRNHVVADSSVCQTTVGTPYLSISCL